MPKRGEIWKIDFNPTKGREISKLRPAIVISSDATGKLPLKLVAPVTGWKAEFTGNIWHVRIEPHKNNGLTKVSAADVLQIRSVDLQRFKNRIGRISPTTLEEIAAAIAAVIEYQ